MKKKFFGYVGEKKYYPRQIPGEYYPNMDHIELIEAQLTKEGMLAYDSIEEASIAAFQEMILFQRRAYFQALRDRYSPGVIEREPITVNFSYPLMHMIATGQLFEPYIYHPEADIDERRKESEACLELLEAWVSKLDENNMPKTMQMDWDGEWLSYDLVKGWKRDYVIPEVVPQMLPTLHPTRYITQSNAIRMIIPAKGMLPLGSYIGSPGFGLIHPTTISAAVLQDAGFYAVEGDPYHPFRFDAISLAPNFDIPTGRNRLTDIVSLITQWELFESEEEDCLVYIPPDDMSFDDFLKCAEVQLNREPWDQRAHHKAFETATKYTEDQLLSHHMTPMLINMGTNVRAILYQHALSRAGLDQTPLRDALTNLLPIINEAIDHAWLYRADYQETKDYIGDHPSLAEAYPIRKFRQLLWDVVGCEAAIGHWQQFTSEEQRLILYASFYGIPAPERVPYQKGEGLYLEAYEVTVTEVRYESHGQCLVDNAYSPSGEEGEQEPVIAPPPPTESELDDPNRI